MERLSNDEISSISNEKLELSNFLLYEKQQLLDLCKSDYQLYLRLRLQLIRIYTYHKSFKSYDFALDLINNSLQMVFFDDSLSNHDFELYYLRAMVFYSHHKIELAEIEAKNLFEEFYDGASNNRKVSIHKIMALTSRDANNSIMNYIYALNLLDQKNYSDKALIYKKLAFLYLESDNLEKSISYLVKFLKLSIYINPIISYDVVVTGIYLELIQTKNILSNVRLNELKTNLEEFTGFLERLDKNYDIKSKHIEYKLERKILNLSRG